MGMAKAAVRAPAAEPLLLVDVGTGRLCVAGLVEEAQLPIGGDAAVLLDALGDDPVAVEPDVGTGMHGTDLQGERPARVSAALSYRLAWGMYRPSIVGCDQA